MQVETPHRIFDMNRIEIYFGHESEDPNFSNLLWDLEWRLMQRTLTF